jgi:hypothetical protein
MVGWQSLDLFDPCKRAPYDQLQEIGKVILIRHHFIKILENMPGSLQSMQKKVE